MHYLLVSLSHKNSDIVIREKFSFDTKTQLAMMEKLVSFPCINEAVVISTCNRLEVVVNSSNTSDSITRIFETLNDFSGVDRNELEGRADIFEDEGAVKHLFSVAGALESIVVGENQIIGQLKESFNQASNGGYCQTKLSRLFTYAFKCAAEIKSVTDIGKNPVSVASAAVAQAKESLGGNMGGFSAVIFGSGEMSVLTAKHLVNHDVNVILVGRDVEKTIKIASEISDKVIVAPYAEIGNLINSHRIFFTATSAPHAVITGDMVQEKEFKRYWFDLAVPRDIDIKRSDMIDIYTVDDLKSVVEKNMSLREEEASKAYKVVGEYTTNFFSWLDTLSVDPIIKELRKSAQVVAKSELDKAVAKGYLPEEYQKSVSQILHNAFKNFLHQPTVAIKEVADKQEADDVINIVKRLFDIEQDRLVLSPKNSKNEEDS